MTKAPRVAVFGTGHWGQNHLRVFNRLGALAAVVEKDPRRRSEVAAAYPHINVYEHTGPALADASIQAAVIATPAPTHCALAKEALLAGKDVLVEKPMALNAVEGEELVTLAAELGRVLMVGHLLLYRPAVQKLISCVREGLIGEVRLIEMRRRKLGRVRKEENVLWSFAPHDIAVLLHLVGSLPLKVEASGLAALQPAIEDDVRLNLTFPGGARAHLHLSWLWPEDERRTVIIGTSGALSYDEHEDRLWLYDRGIKSDLTPWDKGRREIPVEGKDAGDALENEARHFLECVARRAKPLTDGKTGMDVIRVLVQGGGVQEKGFLKRRIE